MKLAGTIAGLLAGLLCIGVAHAQVSDADLTREVETILRAKLPVGAKLTVPRPLEMRIEYTGGRTHSLSLANLAENCGNNPPHCKEFIARFVSSVGEVADGVRRDPSAIRLVLRSGDYVRGAAQITDKSPKPEESRLVSREYLADIRLIYVFDAENSMRPMNQGDMRGLGLADEQLNALAMKNLDAALPPIEYRFLDDLGVYLLKEDDYSSSQILLLPRWQPLIDKFGPNLVIAVSNRNFVFFVDGKDTRNVHKLREVARYAVAKFPYSVSAELLRWTPNGWQIYAE